MKLFILIFILVTSGCGKHNLKNLKHIENSKSQPDLSINEFTNSEQKGIELYKIAMKLQKASQFQDAISLYREIIEEFPDQREASNSLYMIGYIYSNHLREIEKARIALNLFVNIYGEIADPGLVAGAKFELEYMNKAIGD